MATLSNLAAAGWNPLKDEFVSLTCDECGDVAWFTRMQAPDCQVTALAGVGGARSDAYGIYCANHA